MLRWFFFYFVNDRAAVGSSEETKCLRGRRSGSNLSWPLVSLCSTWFPRGTGRAVSASCIPSLLFGRGFQLPVQVSCHLSPLLSLNPAPSSLAIVTGTKCQHCPPAVVGPCCCPATVPRGLQQLGLIQFWSPAQPGAQGKAPVECRASAELESETSSFMLAACCPFGFKTKGRKSQQCFALKRKGQPNQAAFQKNKQPWKLYVENAWKIGMGLCICLEDEVSHPASSCLTPFLLSHGSGNEELYCVCRIYIMHTFIPMWARAFNNMFWSVLQLLRWHNKICQDPIKVCFPIALRPVEVRTASLRSAARCWNESGFLLVEMLLKLKIFFDGVLKKHGSM